MPHESIAESLRDRLFDLTEDELHDFLDQLARATPSERADELEPHYDQVETCLNALVDLFVIRRLPETLGARLADQILEDWHLADDGVLRGMMVGALCTALDRNRLASWLGHQMAADTPNAVALAEALRSAG